MKREYLKDYGIKEIEVQRVVKDIFIDSFMGVYLTINNHKKEGFKDFCDYYIQERFDRTIPVYVEGTQADEIKGLDSYKFVEDNEGNVIDMHISRRFLMYILKDVLMNQKNSYIKALKEYKNPSKEIIETNDNILELYFSLEKNESIFRGLEKYFDFDFDVLMTPTEIFTDIIYVNSANKLLKEQGILKANQEMKGTLPVDETFSKNLKGYVYTFSSNRRESNTSIRWTIKGSEEAREVILKNIPVEKLDKWLLKKANIK